MNRILLLIPFSFLLSLFAPLLLLWVIIFFWFLICDKSLRDSIQNFRDNTDHLWQTRDVFHSWNSRNWITLKPLQISFSWSTLVEKSLKTSFHKKIPENVQSLSKNCGRKHFRLPSYSLRISLLQLPTRMCVWNSIRNFLEPIPQTLFESTWHLVSGSF